MVSHRYAETRFLEASEQLDVSRLYRDFALNYLALLPVDRSARCLDLGCGLGFFLDWLGSLGYSNRQGVDISGDCVEATAKRHPAELVSDSREFLEARAGHWDLIVVRHVIAHLEYRETIPLLSAIYRALAPGGRLLLETFNGALPTATYTLANDFTHRQMFTEASLRQVLRLGDFEIVEVRPGRNVRSGARAALYGAARALYERWLRVTFLLERGAGNNPTTFAKFLVAIGDRPK